MTKTGFLKFAPLLAAIALAGCAGNGSSGSNGPGVRVINGLTSVTNAVVMSGNNIISSNLQFGTLSGTPHNPYSIIPIGPQPVTLASVDTPTTIVDSTSVNLTTIQDQDLIAYNSTTPTFLVLNDDLSVPSTANLRFVNASTATGSVDIVVTPPVGSSSLLGTIAPGGVIPAQPATTALYKTYTVNGTYILQVFPAGHDTGTPLATTSLQLATGVSWSFVLLDPATGSTSPTFLQVQDNKLYDSAP